MDAILEGLKLLREKRMGEVRGRFNNIPSRAKQLTGAYPSHGAEIDGMRAAILEFEIAVAAHSDADLAYIERRDALNRSAENAPA